MKISTLKTYAKNNFPGLKSKKEIEENLRAAGFCKTVQAVNLPEIFAPKEQAASAIFKFDDSFGETDLEEIVYFTTLKKRRISSITAFFKRKGI
jgi:hypothetical protein